MPFSTNQLLGIDYSPEDRFKQVYESSMVGILFWDLEGGIIEANDKLLNMIGYTREEMLKGEVRWSEITPPEYAYLDEQACELLLSGVDSVPYEKQYIHKDGHRIDILISSAMVKNSTEFGMACILDISAQKQAEEALKKNQAALAEFSLQLARSNRDLEQFATIIAHDFQNPLRKLSMFAQHVESHSAIALEPEAQDDIRRILRLAKKMQEQCQNLLALSRVSRAVPKYERVDLGKIAREVLLDLHYILKEYGAQVKLGEMTEVKADPSQLKLLLNTVIETILHLSKQYGLLEMTIFAVKQENRFCEIHIRQNIPDLSEALFENPYADKLGQKRDGINIDVAIIKQILERHQGYATVCHLPDGKSEIVIGIPL